MTREERLVAYTEHVAKVMCLVGQWYHVREALTEQDGDVATITYIRTNKSQSVSIYGELQEGVIANRMECKVKIEYKNNKGKMTSVEEWRNI